ncbi:MAG: anthranilate phosphoribosyltransferase [Chloroflexota bacterium]
MISEAIERLVSGASLTFEEASGAMDEIMTGQATPAQIGAFMAALRAKGETVDEIAGLASVMREKAVPVAVEYPVVDTCGTGGDNSSSLNISTAAAFVVAGAGLAVAKHGNRSMTSRCGSADVLEALGVRIDLAAEGVARCLDEAGIGFMFAPMFHPAMKYAAGPRREIGIRTVFNVLGPLTNPARSPYQVVGVPARSLGDTISRVLHRLGTGRSLVVHGHDGFDEVSISGRSVVWDVDGHGVAMPYEISPEDLGLRTAAVEAVRGSSPAENAAALRRVLSGEPGAARDIVMLNAAAALLAGGRAASLREGVERAAESIDSQKALDKLERLVAVSNRVAVA